MNLFVFIDYVMKNTLDASSIGLLDWTLWDLSPVELRAYIKSVETTAWKTK